MKQKTKAALALSVASVMACGLLAGCDLVTTDAKKDYEQVIAEVNISKSEEFAEGGAYAAYKDIVEDEPIYKRDMVASFVSSGSTVMGQYGWTYKDTFDAIKDSLVNRQVYVQYAKVYFLSQKNEDGTARFTDENGQAYTVAGYRAAEENKEGLDKSIAGLTYFLTEEEEEKALYGLRVSFNSSLDTMEEDIIVKDDDDASTETVRTTPNGVETENEDYYDPDYRIYTGSETALGSYEKKEGSTVYTRMQAYSTFLTNVRSSGLLNANEDTTRVEELSYFKRELKSAYESAIIDKLSESFEEDEASRITDAWVQKKFDTALVNQKDAFKDATGSASVDDALDSMSDSSFVLAAPQAGYGFVINILLPFSAQQQQDLKDVQMDKGDLKGNKYVTRAGILARVRATDQRGTWFTGETDYSYEADLTKETEFYAGTLGNEADRKYLFFKNSIDEEKAGKDKQYELLANYFGKYTYNGTVTKEEKNGTTKYTVKPKKITVDDFISEMEGYLKYAGLTLGTPSDRRTDYYNQQSYYAGNKVDYSKFVYYEGSVEFDGGFNANEMFVAGTEENNALSVINELSFAYNTDTAGLNTYLGYAVTPKKTDFVSEFEYAAQVACAAGAGHYVVVPSDYGWHILYCTFSFTEANVSPFVYNPEDKEIEKSFSNLFFETQKSEAAETYSNKKRTDVINRFAEVSATVYENRYADLSNLDLQA